MAKIQFMCSKIRARAIAHYREWRCLDVPNMKLESSLLAYLQFSAESATKCPE
jgi:hypothetical protein